VRKIVGVVKHLKDHTVTVDGITPKYKNSSNNWHYGKEAFNL